MSSHFYDSILRQGRLLSGDVVDIAIASGKIAAIAPEIIASAELELQLNGQLVSPPFVESHIHLDSALTAGEPRPNQSDTLFEGIDIWRDRKQSLTLEDVKKREIATLKLQASQGVLFVRSHADVSEMSEGFLRSIPQTSKMSEGFLRSIPQTSEGTLIALQGLLQVRDEVKDWMNLQVVAFPQDGIYGQPQNEALLETALQMGADVVGGIPHYELTREDGGKVGSSDI